MARMLNKATVTETMFTRQLDLITSVKNKIIMETVHVVHIQHILVLLQNNYVLEQNNSATSAK